MKVLVIGRGGREHALAWALAKDNDVCKIYAAPGNPGISAVADCVPIQATDIKGLVRFAEERRIDLTIVGPEDPLALGVVDEFEARGLRIFGPNKKAAQIESSKSFAKDLFARLGIPTARWRAFEDAEEALKALVDFGPPWVVKADGLASGRGVDITMVFEEAEDSVVRRLSSHGRILLEEFIDGWEVTCMATIAGEKISWMTPVFQDYKPIFDNDHGANTGGMGVFTPVADVNTRLIDQVRNTIFEPISRGLVEEETPFYGLLCLNAIIPHGTEDPKVLEFNARFGDPEAQGLAPLIRFGFARHCWEIANKEPVISLPTCSDMSSVVVVLASEGYPVDPTLGVPIDIHSGETPGVLMFHAGTEQTPNGDLVTAGGRVLNIVATGPELADAREKAYRYLRSSVSFAGMQFRTDIAAGRRRTRTLGV